MERLDLSDNPEVVAEAEIWKEKARRALDIPPEWVEDVGVYLDAVVYLVTPIRDAGRWPKWADDTTPAEGQSLLPDHQKTLLINVRGRAVKKIFFRQPPVSWKPSLPLDYPETLQ